jgi:hypothetical protein
MFGYGESTYMVPPTTIGAASCPRFTPVENVNATCRFLTLSALMSASSL